MRSQPFFLVFCIVLLAYIPKSVEGQESHSKQDRDAVHGILDRFSKSLETGDSGALLATLGRNARLTTYDGQLVTGSEAVSAACQQKGVATLQLKIVEALWIGNSTVSVNIRWTRTISYEAARRSGLIPKTSRGAFDVIVSNTRGAWEVSAIHAADFLRPSVDTEERSTFQ